MRTKLTSLLRDKGNQIFSVSPEATVLEAIGKMTGKGVGAVLVVVGQKPVGIFTERDVLSWVAACQHNPADSKVGDVMTKRLAVVEGSTTVGDAMAICSEKRCRHLPVMDGDKLLGLVSSGDLTRWVTKDQNHEIQSLIRYITGQYPA